MQMKGVQSLSPLSGSHLMHPHAWHCAGPASYSPTRFLEVNIVFFSVNVPPPPGTVYPLIYM